MGCREASRGIMGGDDELARWRRNIDEIDGRILELLNERFRCVQEIGKRKNDTKRSPYDPAREREVIKRLVDLNEGPFPDEAVEHVFREIMSAALALQIPKRIAYLGPEATFTHQAAVTCFGRSSTFLPQPDIPAIFEEVERGRAEFGVVPVENSTEGAVNRTLDMFVNSPLKIYAEFSMQISLDLLSLSGDLSRVKKVYSHPQGLAQSRGWLAAHLPHAEQVETASTSLAAEVVSRDETGAAVSSRLAAALYGLQIAAQQIEDLANNHTRFLVISDHSPGCTGKDKTSIMFSVEDRPGILYETMAPLAKYNINLTKIESRPLKTKPWEYLFFIDFDGHAEEEKTQRALEQLKAKCSLFKVLGSYSRG